jgi:hypothetical protein
MHHQLNTSPNDLPARKTVTLFVFSRHSAFKNTYPTVILPQTHSQRKPRALTTINIFPNDLPAKKP